MIRRNTLKYVAERAGVSTAAVSYALSGNHGVSSEMRARILKIAAEVGYRPSLAARCLKSKKIHDIGFLVFERYNTNFLANLAFAEMMVHFIEICKNLSIGFQVEWFDISRPGKDLPQMFSSGLVGGIVTAGYMGKELKRFMDEHLDIPVVNVYEEGKYSVCVDAFEGTKSLVRYLAENGHRRIGYVDCSHEYDIFRSSYKGFCAGLMEAGLEYREDFRAEMPLDNDLASHIVMASETIYLRHKDPPTAIIASGSNLARGMVAYLKERGVRIPEDLSFITRYTTSRDNLYNYPQISALEINLNPLISTAVDLLRSLMDGKDLTPKKILLMPELAHRATDRNLNEKPPENRGGASVRINRKKGKGK